MSQVVNMENIQNRIFTIRGVQVMLDSDLAEIYEVETKVLNQAVKRNIERFPEHFRFQITENELLDILRSQNVTSKLRGGRRYLPYAFTEQGVSMLSAVLRSKVAIQVSIKIIDAFIEMRKFLNANSNLFIRVNNLEQKQIKTDVNIGKILNALDNKQLTPTQGIFYNGQVFDAYTLIADIIRSAKQSIIIIDNYIDDTVLKQLAKRNKTVEATVYANNSNKIIKQDIEKHNQQYQKIKLKKLSTSHDRFLIIDKETVYHFGASLKDAGKKWFAFSKLKIKAEDILEKL